MFGYRKRIIREQFRKAFFKRSAGEIPTHVEGLESSPDEKIFFALGLREICVLSSRGPDNALATATLPLDPYRSLPL